MTDSSVEMTEMLLKELLQTVLSLQQDVSDLKKGDKGGQMSQKLTRSSGTVEDQSTSHNGEENNHHHSTYRSNTDLEMDDPKSPDTVGGFMLFKEGEAFFEAIFNSRIEYASKWPNTANQI